MEVFCGNQVRNQVKRSEIMCVLTEVDCYNQVGNQVIANKVIRISLKSEVIIMLEIKFT